MKDPGMRHIRAVRRRALQAVQDAGVVPVHRTAVPGEEEDRDSDRQQQPALVVDRAAIAQAAMSYASGWPRLSGS
jgi:hypothetical protein